VRLRALAHEGLVTLGRPESGISETLLTSRYATNSLTIPLALVGFSSVVALFGRLRDRSIQIDLLLFNVPFFLVLAMSFAVKFKLRSGQTETLR